MYIDEGQPVDYFHSPDVLAPAGLEEGMISSVSIVEPHGTSMEETQYDLATDDGPSSSDTGTRVSRSTASTFDEPNQPSIKAELNGIIIGYSHLIMPVPQLTRNGNRLKACLKLQSHPHSLKRLLPSSIQQFRCSRRPMFLFLRSVFTCRFGHERPLSELK